MFGIFSEGNLSDLPEGGDLTEDRAWNIQVIDSSHANLDILTQVKGEPSVAVTMSEA